MARISKVSQSNPVRLPNKAITERPAFHGPMRFTHQPFQREDLYIYLVLVDFYRYPGCL